MNIRTMTRCALFTALITVCAWLSLPLGDIRVSMQTFGVLLCLGVLGGRLGSLTCLVYLLLGLVGLPVFSGMQSGASALLGPTGGYLWGFLLGGMVFRLLEGRFPLLFSMIAVIFVCYFCGTGWYCLMYLRDGIWFVFGKCVLPYLIPDALKLMLALKLTPRLKKYK